MVWFIVLNIVLGNGDVYTDIHFPNKPEYNNEQSCNEVGRILVDQKQLEIGTSAGRTYFSCQVLSADQYKAATGKAGSNS